MRIYTKKQNFTLAEVLITLAVIGVVAAITIGVLYKINQERIMITKLAATYSVLLDGFRMMVQQNGTIDTYGNDTEERMNTIIELLPQYIKMNKCTRWKDCIGKNIHLEKIMKFTYVALHFMYCKTEQYLVYWGHLWSAYRIWQ